MRRLALAVLALALAACSDNSNATGPFGTVAGTYSLRTINGTSLPYAIGGGYTLTSDVVTLSVDGTYSDVAQFNDGTDQVEQGYYTSNNGSITFTPNDGSGQYSGSVSGSVLTEFVPGYTETFQRM